MFSSSPESIIESAKYSFISEDFNTGFTILRGCFDENEVSNETIFSLLKGEIGYVVNEEGLFLSEDIEVPEEYKEDITSVLENYDFLTKVDDAIYQVRSAIEFDVSNYADTNDVVKAIKHFEGKLTSVSQFKYFNEAAEMMIENGHHDLALADYILYHNKQFFLFQESDTPVIESISKIYSPIDAVNAFVGVRHAED